MSNQSLGERAYNAYCDLRGWKSFSGDKLPAYSEQKPELIAGWEAAGKAARTAPLDPDREMNFITDLDEEAVLQELGRALESGLIAEGSAVLSAKSRVPSVASAFVDLEIKPGVTHRIAVILANGDLVNDLEKLLVDKGNRITVTTMPLQKLQQEVK